MEGMLFRLYKQLPHSCGTKTNIRTSGQVLEVLLERWKSNHHDGHLCIDRLRFVDRTHPGPAIHTTSGSSSHLRGKRFDSGPADQKTKQRRVHSCRRTDSAARWRIER